jgi:hypothetical protein
LLVGEKITADNRTIVNQNMPKNAFLFEKKSLSRQRKNKIPVKRVFIVIG